MAALAHRQGRGTGAATSLYSRSGHAQVLRNEEDALAEAEGRNGDSVLNVDRNRNPELVASRGSQSHGAGEAKVQWKSPILQARQAEGASFRNESLTFAADMLRSESARVNAQLVDDYTAIMRGDTVYIHNFLCSQEDLTLYHRIKAELVAYSGEDMEQSSGLIDWSKHQVFENPTDISPTFNAVVEMLAEFFDIEPYATRLNYYRDGSHWKPQHHDSHAYGKEKGLKEDFTAGLSLGATRALSLVHVASGRQFEFPQLNGDCFAFTDVVNTAFTHGVPKVVDKPIGDRLSIIVWGRRTKLTEFNGGGLAMQNVKTSDGREVTTMSDAIDAAHALVSIGNKRDTSAGTLPQPSPATVTPATAVRKKKNRLQ